MIKVWKQDGKQISQTAIPEKNCWIDVVDPSVLEIESLKKEYHIPPDIFEDIKDIDERSRVEKEDEYILIIIRIPKVDLKSDIRYLTVPVGIILQKDVIITICMDGNDILRDFSTNKVKNLDLSNHQSFVLNGLLRSATYYLRFLKEINKQTALIEKDLQKSVKNNELIHLLSMEKSLVYFTTSLKANEVLIGKLQKTFFSKLTETQTDLLEDVLTENKQAIEMSNIYSNILSGMMDAFASVISNNLNVVMKRLTKISVLLMIPTLIASFYGMNVLLPFQHSPSAWLVILILSIGLSLFGFIFIITDRFFKNK